MILTVLISFSYISNRTNRGRSPKFAPRLLNRSTAASTLFRATTGRPRILKYRASEAVVIDGQSFAYFMVLNTHQIPRPILYTRVWDSRGVRFKNDLGTTPLSDQVGIEIH